LAADACQDSVGASAGAGRGRGVGRRVVARQAVKSGKDKVGARDNATPDPSVRNLRADEELPEHARFQPQDRGARPVRHRQGDDGEARSCSW